MAKYNPIRNIVENLLICTDEDFKNFLVPYVNEALEDHTDDRYLSWGYDDDDTPLERLKAYWGDIANEDDPDLEINEEECKTIRECREIDIEKIEKFIFSEAIKIDEFEFIQNKWIYTPLGFEVINLIHKYVDTTLNAKMLENDINALLVTNRFEHFISVIDNKTLIKIIGSEYTIHHCEYMTSNYITINGHQHFFGRDEQKCIMNELKKRLGVDLNE